MATIDGTAAGDTLWGGDGADVIDGFGGDDVLHGGLGSDALRGGAGNDILYPGLGDDQVEGGAGRDAIFLTTAGPAVIDLQISGPQDTGEGRDTIIGVENVVGSNFNDRIFGDAAGNLILGRSGDDLISGRGAADWLYGDDGADELLGDEGPDTLDGGLGSDSLLGGEGNDVLLPGPGADWLTGGDGDDVLRFASDTASKARLDGGGGFDVLHVTGAAPLTVAQAGESFRVLWNSGSTPVADSIELLKGGSGADLLDLSFRTAPIWLQGGEGADTLIGGQGADTIDSGVSYYAYDPFTGRRVGSAPPNGSYEGSDLFLGGGGDDYLVAWGPDSLFGGDGDDFLHSFTNGYASGGSGADTFRGGGVMEGGPGDDRYEAYDGAQPRELAGGGTDTLVLFTTRYIPGGLTYTLENTNIEHLTLNDASSRFTALRGSESANHLTNLTHLPLLLEGLSGNDTLTGGSGAETLLGGAGDDLLAGGNGSDRLVGGDGYDVAAFAGASSDYEIVRTADGAAVRHIALQHTDTLAGVEALLFQADGPRVPLSAIFGTGRTDAFLSGTGGTDYILALAGDDQLAGWGGNDTLDGGAGWDQAVFDGLFSAASFRRNADGSVTVNSSDGVDRLIGVEAVWFNGDEAWAAIDDLVGGHGTAGNDGFISGTARADALYGLAGDDQLAGWAGDDTLDGGAGWDQAVFDGRLSATSFRRNADGSVTATGSDGVDRLVDVEAVWFNGDSAWAQILDLVGGHGTAGNDGFIAGTWRADRLYGLAGDDQLAGWGGSDTLDGGAGWDQAVFDGRFADASFRREADGSVTVTSSDGVDRLINMEAVWFNADQTWARLADLVGSPDGMV